MALEQRIDALFAQGTEAPRDEARAVVRALREALSAGIARAAEPDPASPTGWRVNAWVKRGILLAFRFGTTVDLTADGRGLFFDKDTLPLKPLSVVEQRPCRARRLQRPGRRLPRTLRHLHAADVREHRRLGGR